MMRIRSCGPESERDSGYTLIELLVAMGIFTVVLTIIMGGVVVMVNDLRKTSNQTDASDQVRAAILRMNKTVPYADAISAPVLSGSDWYVSFSTTASGQDNCQAYRLLGATDVLQHRKVDNKTGSDTGWDTIATNIMNDPTTQQPFKRTVANGSTINAQQLEVDLFASKGTRSTGTAETDVTFVARNSGVNSASAVCSSLLP
jgi:prepilin-type N-terminal cleavage/methylation domain-containing protein